MELEEFARRGMNAQAAVDNVSDAESLRRLVESPWCARCSGPWHSGHDEPDLEYRPPLYERCPEARVPGLEPPTGQIVRWYLRQIGCIEAEHAATLIIGTEATLLAEAIRPEDEYEMVHEMKLRQALASDTPLEKVRALVELHHKLLDSREGDNAQMS